jgi:hypothetical protein
LRQTPKAEPAKEDQRSCGCTEPCQKAVSPPPRASAR